jgi:hypothetical protein
MSGGERDMRVLQLKWQGGVGIFGLLMGLFSSLRCNLLLSQRVLYP